MKLIQRDIEVIHHANLAKKIKKNLTETIAQIDEVVTMKNIRYRHMMKVRKDEKRAKKTRQWAKTARNKKVFQHEKKIARRYGLMGKKNEK